MPTFDLPDLPPEVGLTRPPIVRSLQPAADADCAASGGCSLTVDNVFAEVLVQPTIRTGALITWTLNPQFKDAGSYEFQLLAGTTGNPRADDWQTVGAPAVGAAYLVDDADRLFGKTNWTHYRVRLRTDSGTYLSPPTPSWGKLSFPDRMILKNLYAAHYQNLRLQTGVLGYVLKHRILGEPCPVCEDRLLGDTTDPNCPSCFGTGSLQGYFEPIPCVYAALDPKATYDQTKENRGTVDDRLRVRAKFLAVPQLFAEDVWIDGNNDNRWYVHDIQHIVEWKGVPVLLSVELRLAPYSDAVYRIPIPEALPDPLKLVAV